MSTAMVWFRRDLRLADNPALRAALDRHERVLPVYIHAPDEEAPWAPGAASRWWLHHSLANLDAALKKCGAPLTIVRGDSLDELRRLIKAVDAQAVYWNRLYEPAITARDQRIKQALRDDGLIAESHNAALLFEPWELKTGGGEPYKVFTPFWRNANERLKAQLRDGRAPLPAARKIPGVAKAPHSLALDSLQLLPKIDWDAGFYDAWTPGESGGHTRLEAFCKHAVSGYLEHRDEPAAEAVSQLSPHLHFGEVSPLQIAARIERLHAEDHRAGVAKNSDGFLRQVAWREFGHHLLFHFPQTPESPLNHKFSAFPWRARRDYSADLRAWQRGQTGIPIVDAGMRQLWHTGWMHNRVRLIVASLLTKNLLIPWHEGAAWFWDTLIDADLANNTLGWQWVAGCGADAAPYFRIFNPLLQSARFDGAGRYIRYWLPELAKLPDDSLHAPCEAGSEMLAGAGIKLERDYPPPIVDLSASRDRALGAYAEIKGQ